MGLMHGDLKADNVLVDSSGKASLADFGMSAFMDTMRQLSGFSTESNFCGNLRFASPETLMEDEKSLATDVWAFACMVIQIMKNHPPYHHIKDDRVVPSRIINGEPPWVGEESIFPASDPQLWNEIKLCWSYEPASRPDARRLLLRVREHFYIRPHSVPLPLKWDSELPILTEYIVKSGYVASSASSETFFGYLELGGTTSTHRLSSILRHLGDIEGGKNSKVKVAIKEVRMTSQYGGGNLLWARRSIKLLLREDIDWDQMIHPNIVPLLGYTWEADSNCCLITPWYANGDIVNYLKLHPTVNRLLLTLDIAEGLTYIHAVGLVHGVVKGANVLVNDYGRAKLCDIGLTHLLTRDNQRILLSDPASRMRWMAHEILKKEQLSTAYSDVWSFGCVVMEVMLDIMPYPRLGGWVELQTAITNGLQPLEWSDCPSSEADQHFWEHIYRCWESDPFRRPLMRDMVAMIKQQLALSSGSTLSMSSLNANTQPGTETR
ncbi:hypothetical protein FRC02_010305 [Tulasnella sp. 418]|nr:hypothetical protein FRC02_010305 [Tulasnella sp. 418]